MPPPNWVSSTASLECHMLTSLVTQTPAIMAIMTARVYFVTKKLGTVEVHNSLQLHSQIDDVFCPGSVN